MQIPLFRLKCGVNEYGWGKTGQSSAAARFAAATDDSFTIKDDQPYSELWMGTHPTLPSTDLTTGRSLRDMVADNTALLSPEIAKKYGNALPFLFKVLSIRSALSIQAHPNKKLAEQLHEKDPDHYPDDNHKPEMAIAITDFEGLCGFRPLGEIKEMLNKVKPLRDIIGEKAVAKFMEEVKDTATDEDAAKESPEVEKKNKAALRELFSALLKSPQDQIERTHASLLDLVNADSTVLGADLTEVLQRVSKQYPNDIGCLVLLLLNYIKLSPGEALYLRADDIHAYIAGDIIECMASSDNVVRAGFTPKFQDNETLTSMLTYSYAPIEQQKMRPEEYPYATLNTTAYTSGSSVVVYDPPIEEFAVLKTDLNAVGAKATFEPVNGPSLLVCTGGKGKISVGPGKTEEVREGYVFFIGAGAEMVLEGSVGNEEGTEKFTTFRAFCEVDREGQDRED